MCAAYNSKYFISLNNNTILLWIKNVHSEIWIKSFKHFNMIFTLRTKNKIFISLQMTLRYTQSSLFCLHYFSFIFFYDMSEHGILYNFITFYILFGSIQFNIFLILKRHTKIWRFHFVFPFMKISLHFS